jgi:hypothetical protein
MLNQTISLVYLSRRSGSPVFLLEKYIMWADVKYLLFSMEKPSLSKLVLKVDVRLPKTDIIILKR